MDAETLNASEDRARVVVRPPLLYLGSILLGLALHFVLPLQLVPRGLERPVGGVLVLGSIALFALSIREFRKAGTSLPTHEPTTVIVATGPYRFSRNPIYLSFTVFQLGVAIWHLTQKFGEDYRGYRASVRRWI